MKTTNTFLFFICLFSIINIGFSQSELKFANIGDLKTASGDTIKDCKLGYRTLGDLNSDKSNIILWSTWFTGTTKDIIELGLIDSLINPEKYYIILVDALTNGISSSPSNYKNFPEVSIRDIVNSQYRLLVDHLQINHIYAVMGYSLGGMTSLEWTLAYPNFVDKAISICGTPRLSSRDKLVLGTMANLLEPHQGKINNEGKSDYKNAHNVFLMNLSSPNFLVASVANDSLNNYLRTEYNNLMNRDDYLAGVKTVLPYNIYDRSSPDIREIIKADILLISASQDHILTPNNSIEFSNFAQFKSVILNTDCGHLAPFCEPEKIRHEISIFLDK